MQLCPNCAEVQEINAHLRRQLSHAVDEQKKADADRLSMRESFQAFKDEYARLEAEVARLQLAVDGEKACRHMAVCRLGGLVEGRPTHEGNFLQRIDALVRIEAENAELRKKLKGLT